MLSRRTIATILAEFLGTALLTLVVLAVSHSAIGLPFFIAIAVGLAIASATLVFGGISGAQLNPAITLGLWSVRQLKTVTAVTYIATQLLGALAAYYLFTYVTGVQITVVSKTAGSFDAHLLIAETVGALIFSLAWASVVFNKIENSKAASILGVTVVVAVIIAAAGTGGLINPALALGTKTWVWSTYVLGPVLGALVGFNLYSLFFAPEKELIKTSKK